MSVPAMERRYGRDAATAMHRAMVSTVDEVGRVAAAEEIDCHYAKGGTVQLARSPAQLARAREEVTASDRYGLGLSLVDAAEASARRAPRAAPGVLADDPDRTAARRRVGGDRAGRQGDLRRLPAPDHLRAAHRRRPAGLRRPGRPLPLRLPGAAGLRPGTGGVHRPAPYPRRTVPGPGRRPGAARVG